MDVKEMNEEELEKVSGGMQTIACPNCGSGFIRLLSQTGNSSDGDKKYMCRACGTKF